MAGRMFAYRDVLSRRSEYHPLNGDTGRKQKDMLESMSSSCAPTEIRTPVVALKGLRPGPLDDGDNLLAERADFIIPLWNGQAFCLFFLFGALIEEG